MLIRVEEEHQLSHSFKEVIIRSQAEPLLPKSVSTGNSSSQIVTLFICEYDCETIRNGCNLEVGWCQSLWVYPTYIVFCHDVSAMTRLTWLAVLQSAWNVNIIYNQYDKTKRLCLTNNPGKVSSSVTGTEVVCPCLLLCSPASYENCFVMMRHKGHQRLGWSQVILSFDRQQRG